MFLRQLSEKGGRITRITRREQSLFENRHTVHARFIKLYRSNVMHARDNGCVRLCCFPFPFFPVYSGVRSLFSVGKFWLPPHPPAVSEMSVYQDTIDKRIVLPCDFTLRFHETDGGSGVNYQPAFKLRLAPESGSASASICTYAQISPCIIFS